MPSLSSLIPADLEEPLLPIFLDRAEICDKLRILRAQEETTYKVNDYLAETSKERKKVAKPVDADCRVKMCEWCYQVIDFCKFRRETVGIGLSYLDRYLCTPRGRPSLLKRKEYQLAAMTALYIAIKLHEPLEMETSLLADLSRGCYTEMEFVAMEQIMLAALQWKMNGPTTLQFAQHYMTFLPETVSESVMEAVFDYTRYQIELAVADQSFVPLRMSDVGLAAVLNAMEGIDTKLLPLKVQSKFVRSVERRCAVVMEDVVIIQAKLSLLLVNMLATEPTDIIGPVVEAADRTARVDAYTTDDEDNEPEYFVKNGQILRRINSPVSVLKNQQ